MSWGAGVGPELAEAILRAYPTPLSLRQAYEAAMRGATPGQVVLDAQKLLAGLQVSSSGVLSDPHQTLSNRQTLKYRPQESQYTAIKIFLFRKDK